MKDLDTQGYDVVCVAPRNHMVFTPLLASTCVGTLEFRSVAEPVARIQPAVSKSPGSYFLLARCTGVDPDGHTVSRPPFCLGVTVSMAPIAVAFTCVCGAAISSVPRFLEKCPKGIYASSRHVCFLPFQ
jgi:hypothetical protein